MKVKGIKVEDKECYMLIDSYGEPINPVIKYLKYLDFTGKAENTLKAVTAK
ncbi:hypothetical protein MUO14_07740 [Halobacillus shinanisalinarum]|uniref:Uncharacterized protein n=1 Tax=Halobacillus shinanisalinarum TaxID=2932258 RepID=A0ABY4H2Y2_9BACI|nr:hypothetical protein [Halobacillus shinanisalinarum]UOQ94812.1 hypothetical protein MUO14_07740 [Halobacillus shinanisalinarum]